MIAAQIWICRRFRLKISAPTGVVWSGRFDLMLVTEDLSNRSGRPIRRPPLATSLLSVPDRIGDRWRTLPPDGLLAALSSARSARLAEVVFSPDGLFGN
jgi:hypothetical protein